MPNPTRKKLALIHHSLSGDGGATPITWANAPEWYPLNGKWHRPEIDVVSPYVDQRTEGDLSRPRAQKHGFQIYPTIAETLCLQDERRRSFSSRRAQRLSHQ